MSERKVCYILSLMFMADVIVRHCETSCLNGIKTNWIEDSLKLIVIKELGAAGRADYQSFSL